MIKKSIEISFRKIVNGRNVYCFSKPKSYYEILEVKSTVSQKELRAQFLKKARQLHPDHNKQEKAQEQFKLVKQAYETLKDPQKKYMYDTGISVEPGQETQMHHQFQQSGRKYYENRWYKYEKSKYKDARDEFYQKRGEIIEENSYRNRIIAFFMIIMGVFGYDYYYSKNHKTEMENNMAKELLQNSLENKKKTIIMKKYIEARARQHIMQQ